MSEELDKHIKAIWGKLLAQRREADQRKAQHRQIKLLQDELEKSLPADVRRESPTKLRPRPSEIRCEAVGE